MDRASLVVSSCYGLFVDIVVDLYLWHLQFHSQLAGNYH